MARISEVRLRAMGEQVQRTHNVDNPLVHNLYTELKAERERYDDLVERLKKACEMAGLIVQTKEEMRGGW